MAYTGESYDELIRRSYGYNSQEQSLSPAWATVRTLYEKNYIQDGDNEDKIPKKIHQIWLGGKVPDKYREFMDSWQMFNPTWEYKLWMDMDANELMRNHTVYNKCSNHGMKSDILRYEILRRYGGVYVDTDFECLKPFDDLMSLRFFTGISYDKEMVLYIGIIASVPNHAIINVCVENIKKPFVGNDAVTIMNLTGPYYFTRCFLEGVNTDDMGVVAFPMDFFYPLPNNQRNTSNPYIFIRPVSYAIHHWAVSWIKQK